MSCGYFNVGGLGKAWESNILIVTRTFSFVILPCKIDILNMREHGTASPFVICIYIYISILYLVLPLTFSGFLTRMTWGQEEKLIVDAANRLEKKTEVLDAGHCRGTRMTP